MICGLRSNTHVEKTGKQFEYKHLQHCVLKFLPNKGQWAGRGASFEDPYGYVFLLCLLAVRWNVYGSTTLR